MGLAGQTSPDPTFREEKCLVKLEFGPFPWLGPSSVWPALRARANAAVLYKAGKYLILLVSKAARAQPASNGACG